MEPKAYHLNKWYSFMVLQLPLPSGSPLFLTLYRTGQALSIINKILKECKEVIH
jgi:hypothetical protein